MKRKPGVKCFIYSLVRRLLRWVQDFVTTLLRKTKLKKNAKKTGVRFWSQVPFNDLLKFT